MANSLTGNPLTFDTAAAHAKQIKIKEILWVNDAADIIDGDDLSIVINGATITVKVDKTTDVGYLDSVVFRMGPYNPPLPTDGTGINVTVIDRGVLVVVLQ
jgi:hypothetical protein|tara:strand:- start:1216 stop:1518 length:303 start_codon:yes stop_codon:yes gene_type:complete